MKSLRILFCLLVVLALVSTSAFAAKETIKFADRQWQTMWINNAIAMFIVEHGYEYPVESVVITTPVMQQVLPEGDVHVDIELWRFNIIDWYNEVTESGEMIDLGPTYEKSTQGWYVPRYVIEGDPERGIEPLAPDLKSVFDLPKYKEVFKDPENPDKGQLVNCITGWKCSEINRAKLYAYNLDGDYNILEPGTSPALDAAIAGAYKKRDPVLAYYWEPTWLMGAYDMIQLEEPEYSDECWAEIEKVLDGEMAPEDISEKGGCAFDTFAIHKGIYAGLQDIAPDVVEFLKKMNVGTDPLNKTAAYMEQNDAEPEEAALWYFETFPERWHSWLPEDIAAKVEQALADAGVTFD